MNFTFNEDQLMFRDSVRDFFSNEVTTESIRNRWDSDSGRDRALWTSMAELGLTGLLVPENCGGLGLGVVDFIMLAEECGRVALPEPLVDTVLLATPVLVAAGADAQLLQSIAAGETVCAVQSQADALVADADFADKLIVHKAGNLVLLDAESARFQRQDSVDPSRRLFSVEWADDEGQVLAEGDLSAELTASLYNLGALGTSAQLLGLAQRMLDLSVAYTSERQQFGKPIGSFQAVKHHLANVAIKTEFAKAPVYRAAYSVAEALSDVDLHVSQARLSAGEAAILAAKSGIQVHGAMGYTWEMDLHLFMKRAWALNNAWGTPGAHKARLADTILSADYTIGAGHTFASASDAA